MLAQGVGVGGCARLTQIHSAEVLEARDGLCGEGDGLVSWEPNLALTVATADCLPVVLAGENRLAVVHAGWRGLVAGVLAQAVKRLGPEPERLNGWIGPAIGPCCYEVGESVARAVAATLPLRRRAEIVRSGGQKPYLDLALAARKQLEAVGVSSVAAEGPCTQCNGALLWSYRRDGELAGRNYTFAWLEA